MLVEGIRDSAGRVGFVTGRFGIWGRAARQHRVSTLNVAVTRREYLPMDELPICGMTIDTSADLNHSSSEATIIIQFSRPLPVHYLMHDVNLEHHLLLFD